MIDKAISLLQGELQDYLTLKGLSANVTVDNVGMLEASGGEGLANSVIISVVNVEEESTLKNQPARRLNPPANAVYRNPPVYLNLYVLFTSNYTGTQYIHGLQRISYVVQFFQSKNYFASSTTTDGTLGSGNFQTANITAANTDPDVLSLWFTMELYTMTFEQLNHLWGSLGGRQLPFVMYKLRLVAITERNIVRTAPLIQEIDLDASPAL
jgi:Pvc16 N-terminal domain